MNIALRIERLILDGLPMTPLQRTTLGAALETELVRLLRSGGVHTNLVHGMALPAVHVHPIHFNTPFDPTQAGVQIAQAVYAGIGQPTPTPLGE